MFPYRHTCVLRGLDGSPPSAKARVGWWLALNWDTWAAEHGWVPWVPDRLKRTVCRIWGGHEPVDDQCDKPAHRYCAWCEAPTPHMPIPPTGKRTR